MKNNDVTIVIPVFNALDILAKSLEFLLHTGIDPGTVIVQDDASTDPRVDLFAQRFSDLGFFWHRNAANVGYTGNVNRALKRAASEFVLVMNSDCLIASRTIDGLATVLSSNEYFGVVGPLSNNATYQTIGIDSRRQWQSLEVAEIAESIDFLERRLRWEFGSRPFCVPSVNGFCALWRRSTLDKIGGFDEVAFPRGYGEEDDACFRAILAGYIPIIAPYLFAAHVKTSSFSTTERGELKRLAIQRLQAKHSTLFLQDVVDFFEHSPLISEIRRTGGEVDERR